mgnify:CR=1 FL=1
METSKAQKLWFLLNKIDRMDQAELDQDKAHFPYFYLLHWNERFSVLKQQKIALQSAQRKQYFHSIADISEETIELKELFPVQAKSVTDMGVKLNRATQVSNTVIETQKNIITVVRDSIFHDTVRVKVFSYKDQWYQISGIGNDKTQQLSIFSTDTLTQVVFKGERIKPWLWIFSPRKLQQRVSVSNPNSTIKYSNLIQIQKQ